MQNTGLYGPWPVSSSAQQKEEHCRPYLLQGLFSSVDPPVDDQVATSSEGPGTELTDVVPFVCREEEGLSLTPGTQAERLQDR